MFSTTGLFKGIPCPEGERCNIIHCIFSHELRPQAVAVSTVSEQGTSKKRKLPNETEEPTKAPATSVTVSSGNASNGFATNGFTTINQQKPATPAAVAPRIPKTLQRPVSPPPKPPVASSRTAPTKPAVKESLNPRMIPHDPAGHAKRTLFLKHLHAQMERLNNEVAKGSHTKKTALTMTSDELIKVALDEEEKLARENHKVYANIIKNRVAALKKMAVDEWITHVIANLRIDLQENQAKLPKPIDTGLPLELEHIVLPHLVTDQTNLAKYGYVPTPPTDEEITEAKAGVAASLNYEVCDRCKSRFRVFEERREEDGALTTNGPCTYHWAKPFTPRREKTDAIKGPKEAIYQCCQELQGTPGCTQCETHVFKVSEGKRLASILPFINTPENPKPARGPDGRLPKAVTFDCEMGYTVCGLELIRLTAVSWPEGHCLVDVLVRPQGTILDLNTRWSGVTPEMYSSAVPYEEKVAMDALLPPPPPGASTSLVLDAPTSGPPPIVSSPVAARDLLCSFLTPSTPLIGHGIENDLNTTRLCHPTIIDTIILFPHPRGLPFRFGLKMLTNRHLGRDIQMGGASGHDSLEDARATGDLVRFMVGQRFRRLQREGWTLTDGVLMPPLPGGPPPVEEIKALGAGLGIKRQRIDVEQQDSSKKIREG
jgi:DNA polymerase III epsilon subunit-like protein